MGIGFSVAAQVAEFFGAWVLGALLALLYDGLRALRRFAFSSDSAVCVQDFLFWLWGALTSFYLLLSVADGQLRLFLLLGEVLGAVLYRLGLSPWVLRVLTALLGGLWRGARALQRLYLRLVWRPVGRTAGRWGRLGHSWLAKNGETVKFLAKQRKIRLKTYKGLLYNQVNALLSTGFVRKRKPCRNAQRKAGA